MTKYETAILFDPDLHEDQRKEFLGKLAGIISSFGGEIVKQDDWGIRRLAYPIRKRMNGYYTFVVFTGNRGVVEEIERNIKIHDGILRYLTTKPNTPPKAPAAKTESAPPAPAAAPVEGPGAGPAAPPAAE